MENIIETQEKSPSSKREEENPIDYPSNIRRRIKDTKKKLHAGAVVVAKYLRKKRGIRIGNNAVKDTAGGKHG